MFEMSKDIKKGYIDALKNAIKFIEWEDSENNTAPREEMDFLFPRSVTTKIVKDYFVQQLDSFLINESHKEQFEIPTKYVQLLASIIKDALETLVSDLKVTLGMAEDHVLHRGYRWEDVTINKIPKYKASVEEGRNIIDSLTFAIRSFNENSDFAPTLHVINKSFNFFFKEKGIL